MASEGFLKSVADASAAQDTVLGDLGVVPGQVQISPGMIEIINILAATPLLTEPALRWCRQKQSELAQSQLSVLYTPEQLQEMRDNLKKDLPLTEEPG
jgi:hypothetical protein